MRHALRTKLGFGLCLSALWPGLQAHAQTGQTVIPGRDQIQAPAQVTSVETGAVRINAAPEASEASCPLETSDLRLNLASVIFVDPRGQALDSRLAGLLADLGPAVAGDQPVSVLCRLRDQVNARLNAAGYLALARIPAQEIATGEVRIEVVTARIVEIRTSGDLGAFGDVLDRRLRAMRDVAPLNRRDLESVLLQTGDIPGVDVNLTLRSAGGQPGDMIGLLQVQTRRAQVLVNAQNYGSSQLGPVVATVRGEFYGLTGHADRTYLSYSGSADGEEIKVWQAGHDFALNEAGLRMTLDASFAQSRPDLDRLDLRSQSEIFGFGFSQPLVRSLVRTVTGAAGLEILNQRTRLEPGATPFTRDRLRVAYARLDGSTTWRPGAGWSDVALNGYVEARKGLDVFDASEIGQIEDGYYPSRLDGYPEAAVLRGELIADVHPRPGISIGAQVFGQWSDEPLLNLEEFSAGNYSYGRGYDPGSTGGDRAAALRLEPRAILPIHGPFVVQLTAFYDLVRIWNLGEFAEGRRTLESVGGGVRITSPGRFSLDAVYARPLDRAAPGDTGRADDRVLVSLNTRF